MARSGGGRVMQYMVRATIRGYNPMLDKSVEDMEDRKRIAKEEITRRLMEMLLQDNYIKFTESGSFKEEEHELIHTVEIRGYIDVNEIF